VTVCDIASAAPSSPVPGTRCDHVGREGGVVPAVEGNARAVAGAGDPARRGGLPRARGCARFSFLDAERTHCHRLPWRHRERTETLLSVRLVVPWDRVALKPPTSGEVALPGAPRHARCRSRCVAPPAATRTGSRCVSW
jgi:hypothetical protein